VIRHLGRPAGRVAQLIAVSSPEVIQERILCTSTPSRRAKTGGVRQSFMGHHLTRARAGKQMLLCGLKREEQSSSDT